MRAVLWKPGLRAGLMVTGVVAAAALLIAGVPAGAQSSTHPVRQAAEGGTVVVDGEDYPDPTGCMTVRKVPRRLSVTNNTGKAVRVYLLPGCKGGVTNVVDPGHSANPLGASFQPE
ncbi:hypothetical protein [Nocardia yamanashiensis]|uniref:hypothetical protein n=1 Tax=Nocardia yamanashiensis TaxID=209247 RepID=UPI000AEC735D|nr:hypothetical protein [Nocardia yamanashiensis]